MTAPEFQEPHNPEDEFYVPEEGGIDYEAMDNDPPPEHIVDEATEGAAALLEDIADIRQDDLRRITDPVERELVQQRDDLFGAAVEDTRNTVLEWQQDLATAQAAIDAHRTAKIRDRFEAVLREAGMEDPFAAPKDES